MEQTKLKKEIKEIEDTYYGAASYEGENYKYLAMRNDDIEFLLEVAKKYVEELTPTVR